MPTSAQVEFFARWNEAARRADRRENDEQSMAQRLDAVADLSSAIEQLREGVETPSGVRPA
jgi:hypothetical protein